VTGGSPPTDALRLVVIGAGIAGLAAAWEALRVPWGSEGTSPSVIVLESADVVGGKLQSVDFRGRQVDLAADAFLARRPEASQLVAELGWNDRLVAPGTSGASIYARGRLRAMPGDLVLGVPTRWWPLARSGLLSPTGLWHAAGDLWRRSPQRASVPAGSNDAAVGTLVASRLGSEVVDRLVDPLVGGIHAGGVTNLSAAATFPQLLAAASAPGSLMRALRPERAQNTPPSAPASPVFWSLESTTASLATRTAEALVAEGVVIETGATVTGIERVGGSWSLHLADGTRREADAVVVAVPAHPASRLLTGWAPEAAAYLGDMTTASVGVITVAFPASVINKTLVGTGFLVPRTTHLTTGPALITGVTYLDRKWPTLARADETLVRISVGRAGDTRADDLDDEALLSRAISEFHEVLTTSGAPLETLVTRWSDAFPQYVPGHLTAVATMESEVDALPGLALAGSAYRGVGIPACIGSGRMAARKLSESWGRRR